MDSRHLLSSTMKEDTREHAHAHAHDHNHDHNGLLFHDDTKASIQEEKDIEGPPPTSTSPTLQDSNDAKVPPEHGRYAKDNVVWCIMLLMGLGVLLPWNVALNAVDYFRDIYSLNINFYLPIAYTYIQLPLLYLMVQYGELVKYSTRIIFSFVLLALMMGLLPVLAPIHYALTLVVMVIVGFATAILQSSLIGFSSRLPPSCNGAVMAGQGFAGITAGVLKIATKSSMPGKTKASAILFFELAAGVLLACVAGYVYLLRRPFTKHHLARSERKRHNDDPNQQLLAAVEGKDSWHSSLDSPSTSSVDPETRMTKTSPELESSPQKAHTEQVSHSDGADNPFEKVPFHYMLEIFKKVWVYCIILLYTFTVTFVVFPGVTDDIEYHNSLKDSTLKFLKNADNGWWSLLLVMIFNIFDTVGRTIPSWFRLPTYPLLIVCILRSVFIPLFIGSQREWAAFFSNDLSIFFFMVVFAITNGLSCTNAMMLGPGQVKPEEREVAGFILSLFLQSGIALGGALGIAAS